MRRRHGGGSSSVGGRRYFRFDLAVLKGGKVGRHLRKRRRLLLLLLLLLHRIGGLHVALRNLLTRCQARRRHAANHTTNHATTAARLPPPLRGLRRHGLWRRLLWRLWRRLLWRRCC